MRRSRNALWLLLAGLAGSLLAVRGVTGPQRIANPLPQWAGHRAATTCTTNVVAADRCSAWVLVNGPIAPLSQQAIVYPKKNDGRVDEPSPDCSDPADGDSIHHDIELARLSGTGVGAGGEIACIAAASQPPYDWASLCEDARHCVGGIEVLHLNDRCDGIGAGLSDEAPLDSVDLALAISRFAGPRPACVVSERNPVSPESGGRSISVAGAIFRCCLAMAEHFVADHESAVLATLRAARRSAGQAIGVGLSSCFATPDRAARLWLE